MAKRHLLQILKPLCWIVLCAFTTVTLGQDAAHAHAIPLQNTVLLPPGTKVTSSPAASLPALKAITLDPADMFKINFIVDTAKESNADAVKNQADLLTQYFLAFLTLPEKDLWVNLSPYEQNRIITPEVAKTTVGRDMLIQDYILKHLAASMTDPNTDLGKTFWKRVLARVKAEYGNTNVPVSDFNRVWVVPDRTVVYEQGMAAYIAESKLKVLLEQDYLSHYKNKKTFTAMSRDVSNITRSIILPELEREVNEGKHFAPLRQMYNALVLAIWFKKRVKDHVVSRVYTDQSKTTGIAIDDNHIKEKVYAEYLKAVKKGVYNFIREDYDPVTQKDVPRKYFSGGFSFEQTAANITFRRTFGPIAQVVPDTQNMAMVSIGLNPVGMTKQALRALVVAGLTTAAVAALPSQNAQAQGAQPAAAAAPAAVPQTLLRMGGWISSDDQQNIAAIPRAITLDDVLSLNGQRVGSNNRLMRVDTAYFTRNWDNMFNNPRQFNWALEIATYAVQKKLGVTVDGVFGPETRRALAQHIAAAQNAAPTAGAAPPPPPAEQQLPDAGAVQAAPPPVPAAILPTFHAGQDLTTNPTEPTPGSAPITMTFTSSVAPVPVQGEIRLPEGIIAEISSNRTFRTGERILTLTRPGEDARIRELEQQIEARREALAQLRGMARRGSALPADVLRNDATMQQLSGALERARQGREAREVHAPAHITLRPSAFAAGQFVTSPQTLRYDANTRFSIHIDSERPIDFNTARVTLNSRPVQVNRVTWSLNREGVGWYAQAEVEVPEDMAGAMRGEVQLDVQWSIPSVRDYQLNLVTGAETTAFISTVELMPLRAENEGAYIPTVPEGTEVRAGQIVAQGDHTRLRAQYDAKRREVERVRRGLGLAGSRAELDAQLLNESTLRAELESLATQLERMQVRAPRAGIVAGVQRGSSTVIAGQEIMSIATGKVMLGNAGPNATENLVLVPAHVQVGDPVVIERPDGQRFAARVTALNPRPYHNRIVLNGQSAEIEVFAQPGSLPKNMPVRIIVPEEAGDRQIILDAINAWEQRAYERPAIVPAEAPPEAAVESEPAAAVRAPRPGVSLSSVARRSGPEVNIHAAVAQMVMSNPLTTQWVREETVRMERAAWLAQDRNSGVRLENGNVVVDSFSLRQELSRMRSGALAVGDGNGPNGTLIEGFMGALNVRSGQERIRAELASRIREAEEILLAIQNSAQRRAQLEGEIHDLNQAARISRDRDAQGFEARDGNALAGRAGALRQQIDSLNRDEARRASRFRTITGQNPPANIQASSSFGTIAPADQERMLQEVLASNPTMRIASTDAMRAAMAARAQDAQGQANVRLSEFLPVPPAAISGNVVAFNVLRPLQEVLNRPAGWNNTPQYAVQNQNAAAQRAQALTQVQTVRQNVEGQFREAVGNINRLSAEIQSAQAILNQAIAAYRTQAESGQFLASDLLPARGNITTAQERLNALEREYHVNMAALHSLGLATVATTAPGAITAMPAAAVPMRYRPAVPQLAPLPTAPAFTAQSFASLRPAQTVTPGKPGEIQYQYPAQFSAPAAWALMNNAANEVREQATLDALAQTMANDFSFAMRQSAVQHFLTMFQNTPEFNRRAIDIVLKSPADVGQRFIKFMIERPDRDPQFFIDLIAAAGAQHNHMVSDQGYQALADLLIRDSGLAENLSRSTLSSPDAANRVLLTLILRSPENSIVRERLLQSRFWTMDDLAKIHNQLTQYAGGAAGAVNTGTVRAFAGLIYDEMMRRQVINNAQEVFRPGWFRGFGVLFTSADKITEVRLDQLHAEIRDFMQSSPHWRDMGRFVNAKLINIARRMTDTFIQAPRNNNRSADLPIDVTVAGASRNGAGEIFERLGQEDQREYIRQTQNIAELARILAAQPTTNVSRRLALDRLMETRTGRVQALAVYADSNNLAVLRAVEQMNWVDAATNDALARENAAETDILRRAWLKLSQRTNEQWQLLRVLDTATAIEVSRMAPLVGEELMLAQTRKIGAAWTMRFMDLLPATRNPLWPGRPSLSADEVQSMTDIKRRLAIGNDPRDLDNLVAQSPNQIRHVRDVMAQHIARNDQEFPYIPVSYFYLGVIFFGLAGITWSFFKAKKMWRKQLPLDKQIELWIKENDPREYVRDEDALTDAAMASATGQADALALKAWGKVIKSWQENPVPPDQIIKDVNDILVHAFNVVRTKPYIPDLDTGKVGQAGHREIMHDFNASLLKTLNFITLYMEKNDLTAEHMERLRPQTDRLIRYLQYGLLFKRMLGDRKNIDDMLSYKYDDRNWQERTKIYLFGRIILGNEYLLRRSEARRNADLPNVLRIGNELVPGLYTDPQAIAARAQKILNLAIRTSKKFSVEKDEHKLRKFRGRFLMYGVPAASIIFSTLALFYGSIGIFLGLFGLIVTGFSIGNHLSANISAFKKMSDDIGFHILNHVINKIQGQVIYNGTTEEIVASARDNIQKVIGREMKMKEKPTADLIAIVVEDDTDVHDVEEHIQAIRGQGIRSDVPVEVVYSSKQGSGNAFLEVMGQIKNKYRAGAYKDTHPHLRQWGDARVLIVFHGKDAHKDTTLLDLGIANGYHMTQEMAATPGFRFTAVESPEIAVVYSRDAYFGPVQGIQARGITLMTSHVTEDEIPSYPLVRSEPGQQRVLEIREDVSISDLKKEDEQRRAMGREPTGFNTAMSLRFNMTNKTVKQYPAVRALVFRRDAAALFENIIGKIEGKHLEYAHMFKDLIIPLSIEDEKEMEEYPKARSRKDAKTQGVGRAKKNPERRYSAFYKLLRSEKKIYPLMFSVSVPPPGFETLYHMEEYQMDSWKGFQQAINEFGPVFGPRPAQPAAGAAPAAPPASGRPARPSPDAPGAVNKPGQDSLGGLDLSQTKDHIQFKGSGTTPSGSAFPAVPGLSSFQGFDFQIIQYRPLITPAEFFAASAAPVHAQQA